MIPSELSALLDARNQPSRDAAWKAFVEKYSRLLLHSARAVNRDYDTAMDAYAHTLEKLRENDFRRLRSYVADGRGRFTTWLVVVTRRLCLDFIRHRYGRAYDATQDVAGRDARRRLTDLLAEDLDPSLLSDPGANPETELRAKELATAIASVLAELAPRDRLLLTLRFQDDLPAREIGVLMGFPTVFHVYRQLNALLDRVREALKSRGVRGSES